MSLKPRFKRRLIWFTVILLGLIGISLIVVPPMITLNKLKDKIQTTILQQTGINANIGGDINFSLLGGATIVAHNVTIPNGNIKNVAFTIPLHSIFNIESAPLTGNISVYGGKIEIENLEFVPFNHDINIYNTTVRFLDKDYDIIRAQMTNGGLNGTVRTDQHKYDIDFSDNEFTIRNQNDNLEIYGQLYPDGTARGRISIDTKDINRWFEFSEPKITTPVQMIATFDWDGKYGFKFMDINANNQITGNIILYPDGTRDIQLNGIDLEYNLSFLLNPTDLYQNTKFDLNLNGDLTLGEYEFNHLRILATGTNDRLFIDNIIADNINISGGTINKNGAKNILIKTIYDNAPATCLFSGTPKSWSCQTFTWGNTSGTITVNNNRFNMVVKSNEPMPTNDTFIRHTSRFAKYGHVEFEYSDMRGTLDIDKHGVHPHYTFVANKTLTWLNPNFKFLPEFMHNDIGNFIWRNDIMDFNPHSNKWFLSLGKNKFFLTGNNIKDLFPELDLQSVNNAEYTISGTYNKNNISNLNVQIAGHEFTGTINGNNITLKTPVLNLDAFINQNFIDNYEELEFLVNSPIMIPFDINKNVYLSADKIIYNGDEYSNFVYSLKPNVQTFSISDNSRGNMLAIIEKNKSNYDISLQMNKFVTHGTILNPNMPLNVYDATITADIEMTTSGMIAHDLEYNLAGKFDITFDGGYIIGLGMDKFYASAETITRFNAEYALSDALDGGQTRLKTLRLIGDYKNGQFQTTKPLTLQMRHTDATGELSISDGMMNAILDITMRGTAPVPVTLTLHIAPNNSRQYSLSEFMREFDVSFMRAFIKSHDRF